MAGDALYSKGLALASKGRVLRWNVDVGCLEGVVRGRVGVRFNVRVSADEEGLVLDCQCPHFLESGTCEHVVALGLALLEVLSPEDKALPPRSVPVEERPRTPADMKRWLESHQVTHLERVLISSLEPFFPRGFGITHRVYPLDPFPVVSLLDGTLTLSGDSVSEQTRSTLEQAAWTLLTEEAERVRKGLERERQAVGPPPPTDARLMPLVQALQQVRARVREFAVPRLLPEGELQLLFPEQESPLVVHAHELRRPAGPRHVHDYGHAQCVQLDLPRVLEGEDAVGCMTCGPAGGPRCVHVLSAVDALLDALGEPRRGRENAQLAERLFVVPGRQFLLALEKARTLALTRQEAPPPPLSVSFRLEAMGPDPRLRPYLHRPLKRGGWSKGSPLSPFDEREALAVLSSPEEVEAFELCLMMARQYSADDRRRLLLQALRLLAHSPRLVHESRLGVPLRVREASLGFAFEEAEEGLRVRPAIAGTPVSPQLWRDLLQRQVPPPWLYLELEVPRLSLVSVSLEALAVLSSVVAHGGLLPGAAREELLRHLGGVEAAFPLSLPPSLEGREVPPVPGLLLRLRPTGEEALEAALFVRPLPEAPPLVPGKGSEVVRGVRGGERVRTRRDLEAERTEAALLLERLELPAAEHDRFTLEGPEAALGFLERLEPLTGPSLRVEWEERPWHVVRSPDAQGLKVEVHRERDWFGVRGGVELDGERVGLAVLLDALRRGHRYVPLAPGRWMRLTEALREQLAPLADVAHASRGRWEVSAAAAPVLDGLAEAGADVQAPPDWRHLAGRIREAQRMEVPVPANLRAELRDYQREGFVWMARLAAWGGGGCLADDMGLGKTLQALALLLHRANEGPALVVAPTSVCFNWVREAARFAPSLKVHAYREAEREELLSSLGAGDVVVVSYTLLMREAERFAAVSFATLVLDEAQAVKNPDTARAKAVRALKAEARVALSGTPVENRLSELWSLFRLVFPGLLGSRESFRERFAAPIERMKDAQARAGLARVVRPFLLRRTKGEVARELPPRVETVVPVSLAEGERRLYEDTRLAALARLADAQGPKKRFEVLAALTRLRLAACHPRLVDADSPLPSSKLERFLEVVDAVRAGGGRALVFSQFVKHLALVREALEARGIPFQYLDGQTPAAERETRVSAFQRGEGDVFLISLKAGGTGLNLTAADHVLHLDPWWNPAAEDQATDRAHRIGQTKPVTVTRLISEGTIEEAILALHEEKRDLANSLLSEADGAAALSTEQLLTLLRYGSETESTSGSTLPVPLRSGHDARPG
ncbi:DEAD/DEAH box helicase [Vitiosangium sp. GDMCC 1.1324]|uniref:DEAD/DEAH box helicase n=1 Tax=Vitiosangium sp. (strain GDMCC 1.1324) TaxID=2138576 RepID=UPI001E505E3E|nr:DEAD/DEAH box helicase [Vitiosangium sp. GDMCC 1.1324]